MSDLVEKSICELTMMLCDEVLPGYHREAIRRAIAALEAQPRLPESSADFHQQRGVAWDIIDQAINTYNSYMLDDDYQASRVLREIIEKMRERRDAFLPQPAQPESVKPERESLVEDQGILDDFHRHFGMSVGAWFERDTCSASERFVLTWLIRWLANIDRKLDEARK